MKRVDQRKMDDLREDLGSEKCLMRRSVKSRINWARHEQRMDEDHLPSKVYLGIRRRREGNENCT